MWDSNVSQPGLFRTSMSSPSSSSDVLKMSENWRPHTPSSPSRSSSWPSSSQNSRKSWSSDVLVPVRDLILDVLVLGRPRPRTSPSWTSSERNSWIRVVGKMTNWKVLSWKIRHEIAKNEVGKLLLKLKKSIKVVELTWYKKGHTWNFLIKAVLCNVEITSKELTVSEIKVDGQWSWG